MKIDACIARLVASLNGAGLMTVNSCCGHRVRSGEILVHGMTGLESLAVDSFGRVSMTRPPHAEIREVDGRWWVELPGRPDYIHLGFAPVPRTAWQTFAHHVLTGLITGCPLWRVLRFAWANRHSFGR